MKKAVYSCLLVGLCGFLLFFTFVKKVSACNFANPCPNPGESCTALGCVPFDPSGFVIWVLARALGLGGGVAFLLMISGAIQILTSAGNPEGIKHGTESIASSIQGILFIIFSLFLLKFIGIDILQIPGFG